MTPKQQVDENIKKERKRKRITKILDYAAKTYGCKFHEEFVEELLEETSNKETEKSIPNNSIIDSIIQEWEVWKPYVTEDSFQKFVEYELKQFFKNDCCATSSSPVLNSYIGNKATVLKKLPEDVLSTVITENGTVRKGREIVQ